MAAVFNALLYLTAFLVGAGLLAACTEPLISTQILDFLRTPNGNMVMAGVALVFLLCPLAVLLRWWQVFRRARDISYTTENGKISVSLIAIEEALTRAIEGESEVKKATVRVFEDRVKRSIVIEAIVTLWEVANVTERNRFCQRLLRRRFAELMPEQTVVQVNLTIHRLNQRRLDQRPAHKTTAPITAPAGAQAAQAEVADELTAPVPVVAHGPVHSPPGYIAASDEDLYVGPTYPVVRDDDDDSGSSPIPRSTQAAPPKVGTGMRKR
jgi:hypothetical protein